MSSPKTTSFQKRSATPFGITTSSSFVASNYTGTSFAAAGANAVLSAGNVITHAELEALTVPVFWMGANPRPTKTNRAGRALFYGDAADNSTHDYRVWVALLLEGSAVDDRVYLLKMICTGTFTMGAKTGRTSGGAVKTTDRFADTIGAPTLGTTGTSPKGSGDTINTAFGGTSPTVDSPADDTVAVLYLPELGNPAAVIFDLKMATAVGGNVLFSRET